jgi:hypothetical protein
MVCTVQRGSSTRLRQKLCAIAIIAVAASHQPIAKMKSISMEWQCDG